MTSVVGYCATYPESQFRSGEWRTMEQKRILIVEDELENAMTLCQALLHPMAGGYQVEAVMNRINNARIP